LEKVFLFEILKIKRDSSIFADPRIFFADLDFFFAPKLEISFDILFFPLRERVERGE
jgi:hypothetical protein